MHLVPGSATARGLSAVIFCVGCFALCIPGVLSAAPQQAPRIVQVTERSSDRPLANAEIINRGRGEALFTDERGEAVLPDRWTRPLTLRIRQIGYQFVDTTLTAGDTTTRLRVGLRRVAYVLRTVPVNVGTNCSEKPRADAAMLAADALEQLRMAAERYNTFKTLYPFRARIERLTREFESGRPINEGLIEELTSSDDWGERYAPGRIVDTRAFGFSVRILFLAHLADPRFWQRHCFEFNGFETLADRRVLRLFFAPIATVDDADWAGWVLLDSATSELRRLEFRLTRIPPGVTPQKLEGFTTFMSPSPSIVVPESTAAIWWRRPPASDSARPDVLQLLRLTRLEYRKGRPQP